MSPSSSSELGIHVFGFYSGMESSPPTQGFESSPNFSMCIKMEAALVLILT